MQKYLKLFCSQSVPGLLFLMLSQPTRLSLCRGFTVFTHTCMFFCLLNQSWLLYLGLLFTLTFFFIIIITEFSAQCVFLFSPTTCVFHIWPFPSDFFGFPPPLLFFYSCLTLTALFFSSISICHVCVSVPILFLPSIPRGSLIQRLQSSLPQQHFCCSQAVSCCFVMFGGQSSFEVLSSLLEKGKASLCA